MMWRAFIPAARKDDLDAFPAWFVSFDGQQFVEVTDKPLIDRQSTMEVLWNLAINGTKSARRRKTEGVGIICGPDPDLSTLGAVWYCTD